MRKLIALLRNLLHRDRLNRELTEEVGTAFALLVKKRSAAASIPRAPAAPRRSSSGASIPSWRPSTTSRRALSSPRWRWTSVTRSGCCGEARCSPCSSWPRWRSGSVPPARFSSCSTQSCCGSCRSPSRARWWSRPSGGQWPLQLFDAVSALRRDPAAQHDPLGHLRDQSVRAGQCDLRR